MTKPKIEKAFRLRASGLNELFDCPARWAARNIDKKFIPSTAKALLGKAIHKSTALYDQSALDDAPLTVDEAAAGAVDSIFHPDEDVLWEEEKPEDLEKVALALHGKYCTEIAPSQIYKAVEVECDSLYLEDLGLILTGTTDRIRYKNDGFGITDLKTGRQAVKADGSVETKGHAWQLGMYEILSQHASGISITAPAEIIGLNTGKTDKSQRVATAEVARARTILLGTPDREGILQIAAKIIHSGIFWGNPKSMMCHQSYCPIFNSCDYRK